MQVRERLYFSRCTLRHINDRVSQNNYVNLCNTSLHYVLNCTTNTILSGRFVIPVVLDCLKQYGRPVIMWTVVVFLASMFVHIVRGFTIGFIPNVIFIPYNSNTTAILVNESCIRCGCYAKQQTYLGFNCFSNNNTCSMFSTYPPRYGLNATTHASFHFFELPSISKRARVLRNPDRNSNLTLFLISKVGLDLQTTTEMTAALATTGRTANRSLTSLNDVLVGIWNATVGGNSLVATQGTSNGQYPNANEGPASVLDYNLGTKYNSYGNVNVSITSPVAGVGTGFYVTMAVGSCIVTGIQFATANDAPERDPITMTLEGSNVVNTSFLSRGSSWTLIYSGSTGISNTVVPSRRTYVNPQNFSNTVRYTSYRFIMTSQRSSSTNLQYSEAHLLGYT